MIKVIKLENKKIHTNSIAKELEAAYTDIATNGGTVLNVHSFDIRVHEGIKSYDGICHMIVVDFPNNK